MGTEIVLAVAWVASILLAFILGGKFVESIYKELGYRVDDE